MESTHYKILVVDDEEPTRKLIVDLLATKGHQCLTANNGLEALDKIVGTKFDAVITDIVMPEMDGIALTKEVSKHGQNLPVMVMTGYTEEYSAQTAIASGAREFINKPFSISEFLIRFDKMMRDHKGEEALLALSLIDELTGLYNRRRFFVLTEQYLKLSVRTKKRLLFLFIDMDNLKWINDHHGHNEGDQTLIDLADILKKTFRESDIIARIGGDEFVVLSESTDESGEIVLTRLHENIKDYNAKRSRRYTLSISVGTTQFDPKYPVSIDELLSEADASMYAQKRKRRKQESRLEVRNGSMKNEEKETKPRYGIVNFQKRKYPRFNVDLPIEYSPSGLFFRHGNAANVSEGGLLLYLSGPMEIGQNLMVKLFLSEGSKLNTIETLVQVVWKDILSGEDREDYRTGVKFAYITPEDFEKLKNFLRSLPA
jgi:two-component system cell cycle response regulator